MQVKPDPTRQQLLQVLRSLGCTYRPVCLGYLGELATTTLTPPGQALH
jgi:hypothetical protein